MGGSVLRCVLLTVLTGCGFGLRAGGSVSRSSSPTTLVGSVDGDTKQADASVSGTWMELESYVNWKYARAMFNFGGGRGHTRIRAVSGAMPEAIYAEDQGVLVRASAGLGVSPIMFGPVRPIGYVLYNYNAFGEPTAVAGSLAVGIDVELEQRASEHRTTSFVVGAALIRESGNAQAEIGGIGSYDGSFTSTGMMVTFGWHYLIESFTGE